MSPERKTSDTGKTELQKKRMAARRASAREVRNRLKQETVAAADARATDPLFRCPNADDLITLSFPRDAMRLGFPVKVMGRPGLKSNDTRRWQQRPHLKVR